MMSCRLCGKTSVPPYHECAVQDLKNHAHRLAEDLAAAQHELARANDAFGDTQGRTLAESIEIRQAAWRKESDRLGIVISDLRAALADANSDCSRFCGDNERLLKALNAETVEGALHHIAALQQTLKARDTALAAVRGRCHDGVHQCACGSVSTAKEPTL